MDKHLMTSNNIPEIKMTLYVWRSKLNFDSRFQRAGICSTCLNCARPFWSFKVVQCLHVGGTNPSWTHNNHNYIHILYTYIYIQRVKNTSNIFTLSDYRNYSIMERFDTMPFQNYFASKRETIRSQITSQQECHIRKFLSPTVEMHNAFVHWKKHSKFQWNKLI